MVTHKNAEADADTDFRVDEFLHDFFHELDCPCPACGSELTVPASSDAVQVFYRDGLIQCSACGVNFNLTRDVDDDGNDVKAVVAATRA